MIKLSVIIPTKNRSKILYKALQSIVNQTLSSREGEYEVIVVDNGSTDDTGKIVNSFKEHIKNLVYIYDPKPGLHIGRHRGLLVSKANILVYADDDIEALPTWLESILISFEDPNVVLVGGKNLPNFESDPPDWILKMWQKHNNKIINYLSILDFGDNIQEISPFYIFGCNFSIRKNILLEAGGFHPDGMPQELIRYRGDGETHVSEYIEKKGYKTVYNPNASVYHLVSEKRMTKEYFKQRAYNQGVSDSYTAIRSGKKNIFIKLLIKINIKKYLLHANVELDESFFLGYYYHQEQAKNDPKLLEWIKRQSYINSGDFE
ncbi:glycosyltransferase [Acinetobacter bereziniae]|uniref:glycosyltransferase n=1 Tax=Acinetobacter bereziniae TaxID=106648 RepID=UPI00125F17F1|nr:glycosyltransferase [Acinetobacter bereziniae]